MKYVLFFILIMGMLMISASDMSSEMSLADTIPVCDTLSIQSDWTGGAGQLGMADSTMFFESSGIDYSSGIALAYPDDTTWTALTSYPTGYAVQIVNKIFFQNDTVMIGGGLPAIFSYSVNNGNNWINFDTLPINQSTCEILDFEYIDGVVYVAGYYGGVNKGIVYRSYDFQTWDTTNVQPSSFADRVYDLIQVEGDTFLAVAGNPDETVTNMDGMILHSYDACSTWARVDTVAAALAIQIEKINDSTFIVAKDNMLSLYGIPDSCLMISYDKGETFSLITNPDTMQVATALKYDNINNVLYVGDWIGVLMKASMDSLSSWEYLDTTNVIGDTSVITGIEIVDTVMYVTTEYPGALYKSYDNGYTFELVEVLTDYHLGSFGKFAEHTYGIGGGDSSDGGKIYYSSYFSQGNLISSVFSINFINYDSMFVYYTKNSPFFTSVTLKVRSDSLSDMSSALDWASCPSVASGTDLFTLASINNFHSYLQYSVDLTTARLEVTPSFSDILLEAWYDTLGIIKNMKGDDIIIYNTVITNQLSINNNSQELYGFNIYDISGRNVYSGKINQGKNYFNLDLPAGKYLLNISGNININSNIYIIK